jgi:site-specific DNA-methyltransferase (adenine-specific)
MLDLPPVGRVVQGDALQVLPQWPAACVDLVFADPPFNIKYQYDRYVDDLKYDEYVAWTERWVDECLRVLRPAGALWVAIGDEYAAEMRLMLRRRTTLRNWIIWHYTFGQNCKNKFNRSHAHLFYVVKDPKHFTFNADPVRVPSERQLTYNDKRANPKGRLPHDVWTFSRVCGTFRERVGWHPCQMPVTLLERIVRACSNPGDLVLDPFAGSGTTLVAAARLGRKWVGVEISEQYTASALARIAVEGRPDWKPSVQQEGLSEATLAQRQGRGKRRSRGRDPYADRRPRRRSRKGPPPSLPGTAAKGRAATSREPRLFET